jgi:type II secretory pathway pseudopilin PulG
MNFHPPLAPRTAATGRAAFTLMELMVVVGIMVLIAGISIPGLVGMKKARSAAAAGYTISGLLEQARTYAMANNTYVWVGFFEEDGARSSQNPAVTGGGGRLVMITAASQSGERYRDVANPASFGTGNSSNPVNLTLISKPVKIDNVRLIAANIESITGNNPQRPAVPAQYQAGDSAGQSPKNSNGDFSAAINFTFPLRTAGGGDAAQYTFAKIIEFSPRGEASKIGENVFSGAGIPNLIEIALVPMQGGVIDPNYSGANGNKAAVAIQIEGYSGRVRMYQP